MANTRNLVIGGAVVGGLALLLAARKAAAAKPAVTRRTTTRPPSSERPRQVTVPAVGVRLDGKVDSRIVAAYERTGGAKEHGVPTTFVVPIADPGRAFDPARVGVTDGAVMQFFGGGSGGPAVFLTRDNFKEAFVIRGGFLKFFFGYPGPTGTSSFYRFSLPRSNEFVGCTACKGDEAKNFRKPGTRRIEQHFINGIMRWDEETGRIRVWFRNGEKINTMPDRNWLDRATSWVKNTASSFTAEDGVNGLLCVASIVGAPATAGISAIASPAACGAVVKGAVRASAAGLTKEGTALMSQKFGDNKAAADALSKVVQSGTALTQLADRFSSVITDLTPTAPEAPAGIIIT